jgi:flagellar biosynthetic protein FliQ
MEFDKNVNYLQDAFWQIIMASGPILLVALAIGLFIGIIQAATSINEMTLSFVPKLVLVLITLAFTANFMLTGLSDYFFYIFDQIATIGRS